MTKPLYWVGHARKDLQGMPAHVRDTFGVACFSEKICFREGNAQTRN